MAKLILTREGDGSKEISLTKERFVIGRAAHSDLVINRADVSAEHAVIVAMQHDAYLQDLGSTNGTKVNGQPVKRHYLQHDDIIEIAPQCAISYMLDGSALHPQSNLSDKFEAALSPELRNAQSSLPSRSVVTTRTHGSARIAILNGVHRGQVLALTDWLTTIGKLGRYMVGITRQDGCYAIGLVEGQAVVLINEQAIGAQWHPLKVADVIEINGTRMQFGIWGSDRFCK